MGPEADAGDRVSVRGPRGTRGAGEIIEGPTGDEAGVQTVRLGPFARAGRSFREVAFPPYRRSGSLLWCRCLYRGPKLVESEDGSDTFGRFFIRVR